MKSKFKELFARKITEKHIINFCIKNKIAFSSEPNRNQLLVYQPDRGSIIVFDTDKQETIKNGNALLSFDARELLNRLNILNEEFKIFGDDPIFQNRRQKLGYPWNKVF